jgi:hypothetical protein
MSRCKFLLRPRVRYAQIPSEEHLRRRLQIETTRVLDDLICILYLALRSGLVHVLVNRFAVIPAKRNQKFLQFVDGEDVIITLIFSRALGRR